MICLAQLIITGTVCNFDGTFLREY